MTSRVAAIVAIALVLFALPIPAGATAKTIAAFDRVAGAATAP